MNHTQKRQRALQVVKNIITYDENPPKHLTYDEIAKWNSKDIYKFIESYGYSWDEDFGNWAIFNDTPNDQLERQRSIQRVQKDMLPPAED